jgi:hypothetical protein
MSDDKEFAELVENYVSKPHKPIGREQSTRGIDRIMRDLGSDGDEPKPGVPVQYALHSGGYKPTTATIQTLPPGCYDITSDDHGPFVVPALPPSGLLLDLPEMRSSDVLKLVDKFWDSEKDYKEGNEFVIGGAQYKAGLLLWGVGGSGKSSIIKLVSRKLVERKGTVFHGSNHPQIVLNFLTSFAKIEPNRKCVVILEDIDTLIDVYGESNYLELLDSAKTIDNVLFIATTNYPEKLDPRIYNRPGRFSHVIKVGLPSVKMREAYLKAVLKNHRDVPYIVEHSNNFSIDHLSSLVNSVYREGKSLEEEVKRLRTLFRVPKSTDADNGASFGLAPEET